MKLKSLFLFILAASAASAEDAFKEGIEAYEKNNYAEAAEAFELNAKSNETGAARHNLALALYQLDRPGEAVWQLERALLLEPRNRQYHYKLGALRQQLGLSMTRPAWHEVAAQALSSQTWIILLSFGFWAALYSFILPAASRSQAKLPIIAIRTVSCIILIIAAAALYLNRHQSSKGIVITGTPIELRAAPASAAPQSGLARSGERGQVIDRHEDFLNIETEGGAKGWIHSGNFRGIQ